MLQLQKAVLAVGVFAIFEATLQDDLGCDDGFREATLRLEAIGETALKERFGDMQLAINVLKHGRGRSYEALVAKAAGLPFRVKLSDEYFFHEGDVLEISTLVEVDDAFIHNCVTLVREVAAAVS